MRATGKAALVAVAALSIGLTGCNGGSGSGPGGSTSAGASGGAPGATGSATTPGGGAAGTGTAAPCLVGDWKATGLSGQLSGSGVEGSVQGGAGLTLTVAADGKTTVNFDPMQPVDFTLKVAGGEVKGKFSYGGKVNGVVRTPAGTSGKWEPTGTTDFGGLTVTLDLSSPTNVRLADKLPLKDFTGGSGATDTSAAVDAQPILRNAQYECSGNTLKLSPPAGTSVGGTWTLTKA